MAEELRVYVCRDPKHEELVKTLEELLERVRPEHRPRLRVVQLRIRDSGDFPWYLEYLEELFGGIATAEYRRYGVRSLPAVVYKGRAVVQGRVPTAEELEEALAYEGLRIVHRGAEERAPPPGPTPSPEEAEKPVAQPAYAAEERIPPKSETRVVTRKPPAASSLLEVEEVSVEAPEERPPPSGRTCLNCIFYERSTGRCLLLRLDVRDPLSPPCRR